MILCGHGHANRLYVFEGVPGVMGRSNLRAAAPVGGFNLVEIKDGVLSVSERLIGQQTKPPVALGQAGEARLRRRHQPLPPP